MESINSKVEKLENQYKKVVEEQDRIKMTIDHDHNELKQDQVELKSLANRNYDELQDLIMNLLPGSATPQPSPSSASNPPLKFSKMANPPPFIPTSSLRITNQLSLYTHQPIFAYSMRAKLELSKFDENEKKGVAWFNKV